MSITRYCHDSEQMYEYEDGDYVLHMAHEREVERLREQLRIAVDAFRALSNPMYRYNSPIEFANEALAAIRAAGGGE